MLILQLKQRIIQLENQIQEHEQRLNEILSKLSNQTTTPTLIEKEKKAPFKKPTVQEVYDYVCPPLRHEDALVFSEKFHAHYEAKGWMVGRNSMKDWKAAVRTWDLSKFATQTNKSQTIKNGKFDSDAAQRIYNDAHNYTKD